VKSPVRAITPPGLIEKMVIGGGTGVGVGVGGGVGGSGVGVGYTKMLRPVPLLVEVGLPTIEARSSGCEMIGSGVPLLCGDWRVGVGLGLGLVVAEANPGVGLGALLPEMNWK
jgi:hypothetical protein